MKPKVLVTVGKLNVPEDLLRIHESLAIFEYTSRPYHESLPDATAVLVGTEPINDKYLESASSLRLVARYGVGYDSVDVEACTKRGVYVTHTPDVLSAAVAEHTWALILSFTRHIPVTDKFTRINWSKGKQRVPFGWDLEGKTLGILGLGRIGGEVLKRSQGFNLNLIYNDIVQRTELEEKYGVKHVSLKELLHESDILTIHVPLTETTRGMIGQKELKQMKHSSILVNTSRGQVIDETQLIKALKEKKIRGAALDVYETEPLPADNELLNLENVVLTPHIASATWETRRKMAYTALNNIKIFLEGKRPPNLVPEQKEVYFHEGSN